MNEQALSKTPGGWMWANKNGCLGMRLEGGSGARPARAFFLPHQRLFSQLDDSGSANWGQEQHHAVTGA